MEMDGPATITGGHFDHNVATSTRRAGVAETNGGIGVFNAGGGIFEQQRAGTAQRDHQRLSPDPPRRQVIVRK
jgi:hypothetical protein